MQANFRRRNVDRRDNFETADGRCRFLFVRRSRAWWSCARSACADRCGFCRGVSQARVSKARVETRWDHIVVSPEGLAIRFDLSLQTLPAALRRERAAHRNATQCTSRAKLRRTSVISLPSALRYAALPDEQNPGNARMLRQSDICWKLANTGIDSHNIQACACL